MTISQIYDRYGTPPNLREHMFRVTQLAVHIVDNWKGTVLVNRDQLITAGLLHDLANIVKFTSPEPEIRVKQQEVIAKYGADDHAATEKMLHEIGIDNYIIDLIQNKSLSNALNIVNSSDWNLKILFYSDMRIAPSGTASLGDRLSELVSRSEKYRNHPQLPELISAAKTVESQIQSQVIINLKEITHIGSRDNNYMNYELT